MLPDPGRYEERYRLTFPVARSFAISLVSLIPAIFSHQPLPWLILFLIVFVLATVPWLLAVASRNIAFRADMAGITLGADPLSWPFRHASAVFVPWADVEGIVLYPGGGSVGWGSREMLGIGIQRRQGAPPLSRGNKPARRCPVPGVAAGAVRPVSAWRLDRGRLAALTAAVAPAIPIIDASTGPNPGVEGPGQAGSVPEPGPAD
jgi:4-amino-4-deoxy-L-arabinose transferase-like glycosyltransferase